MTFDEINAPLYRRVYEFHRRHHGAATEADVERMIADESAYDENRPDFTYALCMAIMEEVYRGIGKEGGKA